jgi:hypothetical protein
VYDLQSDLFHLYTCNGIITVDISGVDLASHTGSLY